MWNKVNTPKSYLEPAAAWPMRGSERGGPKSCYFYDALSFKKMFRREEKQPDPELCTEHSVCFNKCDRICLPLSSFLVKFTRMETVFTHSQRRLKFKSRMAVIIARSVNIYQCRQSVCLARKRLTYSILLSGSFYDIWMYAMFMQQDFQKTWVAALYCYNMRSMRFQHLSWSYHFNISL